MRWIAPTEKDEANHQLEKRLWEAADQFRANSGLKAGEYSGPVLGLIFLFQAKCLAVFEHVYEAYLGDGRSVYSDSGWASA